MIYEHKPTLGKTPQSVVILLHGYGSNGADLIDLAPYWAGALPETLFLSPDAPFKCEVGFGFQWFSLTNWTPSLMLQGAEKAAPFINDLVDKVKLDYKLPESRIALVGFSQGTMMSLYTAPRRTEALGGIVGYSGALLGGEMLADSPTTQKPPICLVHGDMDAVVPVTAWYHAKATLEHAGFRVEGNVINGLPHSINAEGLDIGGRFLSAQLQPVQA
jgi:phospholipase/carboxylesterase